MLAKETHPKKEGKHTFLHGNGCDGVQIGQEQTAGAMKFISVVAKGGNLKSHKKMFAFSCFI